MGVGLDKFLTVTTGFLLALTGCVATPSDPVLKPEPVSCAAAIFSHLKWQPETFLTTVTLPKGTRVIRPDTMVTTDYRADRMNISIGKLGRVERVYCG